MPKGDKKRKNGSSSAVKETRQMILKDDETEYGTVVKVLGDGRFTVRIDMLGKEVIGKLCGKFRKGVNKAIFKVALGSVVLLGIREYEDKKR
jgi:translation initiation factor IF-1